MKKTIVRTVDVILFLAFLIALYAGWAYSQAYGLVLVFVGGALMGGAWAALSLMLDYVESVRIQLSRQTTLLESIDESLYQLTQSSPQAETAIETPVDGRFSIPERRRSGTSPASVGAFGAQLTPIGQVGNSKFVWYRDLAFWGILAVITVAIVFLLL